MFVMPFNKILNLDIFYGALSMYNAEHLKLNSNSMNWYTFPNTSYQ
jgi:hypothetical protein